MGISRDSRHKKRLTGGSRQIHQKKRAFERARPPANTKLEAKRVRRVRVRGGNFKYRALRLNEGNFNWASESVAFKTKILNVVYNASNNEYVRTNTLVKNTIVRVDAAPFKHYLARHYFNATDDKFELKFDWEKKGQVPAGREADPFLKRRMNTVVEPKIQEQLSKNALLACISSRPGQCGRADGYLLEGEELEFYLRKLEKR